MYDLICIQGDTVFDSCFGDFRVLQDFEIPYIDETFLHIRFSNIEDYSYTIDLIALNGVSYPEYISKLYKNPRMYNIFKRIGCGVNMPLELVFKVLSLHASCIFMFKMTEELQLALLTQPYKDLLPYLIKPVNSKIEFEFNKIKNATDHCIKTINHRDIDNI